MTQPSDDQRLVEFLQRHQPTPPPADPTLEDRLMAALPPLPSGSPQRRQPFRWRTWGLGLAIPALAASLVWVVVGLPGPQPRSLTTAEQEDLDTFLADTWGGIAFTEATALSPEATDTAWVYTTYSTTFY